MPRTCTICTHDQRREIDRALVARTASFRDIARQHGVSKDAVSRHVREHLPELLTRAHAAEQAAEADRLLFDLRRLQAHTLNALTRAEQASQWSTMLKAVREARENMRLLGELRGRLDTRPQVNITFNAEWIELRAAIVTALEPHLAAKESVMRAIEGVSINGGS